MGTGSSKSKSKSSMVVADIVIPGQSKATKVRGQIMSGVEGRHEPATVTQVAPNQFSVQMGSHDIGTFDVAASGDGDFARHLINAAQMTVSNIEIVANEEEGTRLAQQSFQIQLKSQDVIQDTKSSYSDDEEWEEVLEGLDAKQPAGNPSEDHSHTVIDKAFTAQAKERKARIKQALREKRNQLSQHEYEQMIANHKQEAELMALLRDKERERQQYALESKVARRRQLRKARQTEEESQRQNLKRKEEDKSERTEEKGSLEIQEKQETSPVSIQELEANLKLRQAQFQAELLDKKPQLTDEEYRQLIGRHKEEMNLLRHRLDVQREQQRQSLLDKLAARRARRHSDGINTQDAEDAPMTADEVRDLQLALNHKALQFKRLLKDSKCSPDEMERLIDDHRREMEHLQEQLDAEKERMRRLLMEKLAERRRKGQQTNIDAPDQPPLTAEEVKQLQLTLDLHDATTKNDLRSRKAQLSEPEYQRLLERHNREAEELAGMLLLEKERMEGALKDKMEARRYKRPSTTKTTSREAATGGQAATGNEEVAKLEQEILQKEMTFEAEVARRGADFSAAEYQQLLAEHGRDVDRLKAKLALANERQERSFTDKLSARQRRRAQWQGEEEERMRLMEQLEARSSKNQADLDGLAAGIAVYDAEVRSGVEGRKGKVSESEYRKMLEDHERCVAALNDKLERERKRMLKVLEDKRTARGTKANDGDDDDDVTLPQQRAESRDEYDSPGGQTDDLEPKTAAVIADATSQLWTTPTQSTTLVVVPLQEEYPVKRKRELYTNPDIFRDLDAHAIKLAQTVSLVTMPTFSSLVDELVSVATTELERVRLICRWITAQNCEEMDLNDTIDDTPLGVLKGLYHGKITFSTLFMRMCRFVGFRCVEINGCAKVRGYNPGQRIEPGDPAFRHTWNAVRIDAHWYFVDCNWGVSHIRGSVAVDPFRFEYDEHYFLADPDVIIRSHFPADPAWQLLGRQWSVEEFNHSVLLKPDFFKFGFGLLSHPHAVVEAPQGEFDMRIPCPQGMILTARLSTVQDGRELTRTGVAFSQFVFIHQITNSIMACYIRIPEAGDYYLAVCAKRQYTKGEINQETETEISRYLVRSAAPCQDQLPLPAAPAHHWGPIGVTDAGLTPTTHRTAVIMMTQTPPTDVEVRFETAPTELLPHRFVHRLTAWGWEPGRLMVYSMQRTFNGVLAFVVTPPCPGRYGLHIHALYPGMKTPVHLCSYLLVCASTMPSIPTIPSLPTGEGWGASAACSSLGVSAFTNPDPLVRTVQGDDIQLVMALSMSVAMTHSLTYYGRQEPSVVTPKVTVHVESGSITYVVRLDDVGYYKLTIMGRESVDSDIPFALLYHYLLQKL